VLELKIQKSFHDEASAGVLYLVGTPIGNLEDITYRALKVLNKVDMVAAEDTRQTIKLLNHFQIQKKLISYHEYNKETSGKALIKQLLQGMNIALVSDAGMPAISDPGYELVVDALKHDIPVIPIPGVNAAIAGLVASGLSTEKFLFLGFLPRDKKGLIDELKRLKPVQETLVIYEAPHRIKKTLAVLYEVLGNREMALIRELTKKHEEFIRGSVEEILQHMEEGPIKGEMMMIIQGAEEEQAQDSNSNWWGTMSIMQHVEYYVNHGHTAKEAIKRTAQDRQLPKREVYQAYHGY